MISNLEDARNDLLSDLARRGLNLTPNALEPLQRIDFTKLVEIHDHEEAFLRSVFVSSLVRAHQARLGESNGTQEINAADVRTAMLMLGSAVESASEQAFSSQNKSVIKAVCPYCPR